MPISRTISYEDLDSLFLDPTNPRLGRENTGRDVQQTKVLELMEDWNLDELAVSFVESGFWPQEAMLVVEEELYGRRRLVVVEGNRRLAALMLLKDAASGHPLSRKWQDFAVGLNPNSDLFKKIPVLRVDSRKDIDAFLGFRHVTGIMEWRPAEKAEYIARLIEQNHLSYEDVRKKIGSRTETVRRNYISYRLLLQMEDEEGISVKTVEERFSVLFLSLRTAGVQSYLHVDIKADPAKAKAPVPKDRLKALAYFAQWLFGNEEREVEPLVQDSRQVDDFGRILESKEAVEYLERTKSPSFEFAFRLAGNRSMMIHPSQERARHAQYFHSIQQIREQWEQVLGLPPDDPDRLELLEEFRTAHADLSRTVEDLPSFEMIAPALQRAVRKTQVTQLNSAPGKTPDVGWNQAYAHILVGGQAMDRGFTVKGLTVTYMPRGLGVGNADTVQQRARFFGYKRTYLGYCRIFLDATVRQAYQNYVDHDQDIRNQLARHNETGRPLSDWKRVFFLDSALRPTRSNVLFFDYTRGNYSDDWHEPKAPHDSEEIINANRAVVGKFIATLNFQQDEGSDKRTDMQRHLVATGVRLCDAYAQLLTQLRVTRPGESQRYTGLLLQIEAHLQTHQDATCSIYRMAGGRARERSVDERNEVKNLFQGANYDGDEETYPGDRKLHGNGEVAVQLHTLNILGGEGTPMDVPAVAVWVPQQLARDWISQVQA